MDCLYIAGEQLFLHVKETIDKYRFKINLKKFNKNLVNPIKLTFDSMVYGKDLKAIIESESMRQIDKSNTNYIDQLEQFQIYQEFRDSTWKEEHEVKCIRSYSSIELFSGAGGLALGMEGVGFDVALLNELDKQASNTLKQNRPLWNVAVGDVAELDFNVLKAIYYKVPQKRERLFLVGVRNDLLNNIEFSWPSKYNRVMTLKDALKKGTLFSCDVPNLKGKSMLLVKKKYYPKCLLEVIGEIYLKTFKKNT